MKIYDDFREKFAETRLFEDIKEAVTKMLHIHNIKELEDLLSSDEFNIEVLRDRPHIQCLERIVRMQRMMG